MEPVGVLARCRLFLGLIHVMMTIMGLLLLNYWGLIKDGWVIGFNYFSIIYLSLEILSPAYLPITADQKQLGRCLFFWSASNMMRLPILGWVISHLSSIFHSFAGNDGCEGCYSVLQACSWVMVLLNCLETIVDCLIYDDASRGGDIVLTVGNSDVRVALGRFGGVLIRCGRVLGGIDGLVTWRLSLGTMGAALLTLILGAFGSVMTANVFWTCWWLGVLETILVCASRQKMLDMCVRVRYVIFSGFKIGLVSFTIMNDNLRSLTESSGCKVGSPCYSRLRECFWVMLLFYFLEVLLAVMMLFVHHPRQEINMLGNFYGVILSMSSALSMTQVAIVGLLLGGSYGPLMTAEGFWLCAVTGFIEMAALTGITDWVGKVLKTRIDTRMPLSNARSAFIMIPVLRIVMLIILTLQASARNGEEFFIADMSNCDETCKARGRDLLAICVWTVVVQFVLSFSSFYFILLQLREYGRNTHS